MAIRQELLMTEAEYDEWCWTVEDRTEFVDGRVIFMTPESTLDVRVRAFLVRLLGTYAENRGLGEVIGDHLQARLRAGLRRDPDINFLSNETMASALQETCLVGGPDLAIEILSRSSAKRDRVEKFREYEQAGVREYWIVDPRARRLDAWSLDPSGRYRAMALKDGALHSLVLPGFYIQPEWLWMKPFPAMCPLLEEMGVILQPEVAERLRRLEESLAGSEAARQSAEEEADLQRAARRLAELEAERERLARQQAETARQQAELEAEREGVAREEMERRLSRSEEEIARLRKALEERRE